MLGYFLADRPGSVPVTLDDTTRPGAQGSIGSTSGEAALTVFLLGDDPAMEADLCEHLWSHAGFELLATHYDARSALRLVDALSPAVILVHIGSDDADRLAFIEAARTQYPESLILVSFSKSGAALRKSAFVAGANGELTDIEDATLCHYVMSQAAEHFGKLSAHAGMTASQPAGFWPDLADAQDRLADYSAAIDLSRLEIEIGRYLASGKSISDIASHLSLSPQQISVHRGRIRQSLCCRTNLELNTVLARYLSA